MSKRLLLLITTLPPMRAAALTLSGLDFTERWRGVERRTGSLGGSETGDEATRRPRDSDVSNRRRVERACGASLLGGPQRIAESGRALYGWVERGASLPIWRVSQQLLWQIGNIVREITNPPTGLVNEVRLKSVRFPSLPATK